MPVWAFCTCSVPPYEGAVLPSGGTADTDCAFAIAANPANNPTLRTVDLSKLIILGLQKLSRPEIISMNAKLISAIMSHRSN
jgi:hypothetical protein